MVSWADGEGQWDLVSENFKVPFSKEEFFRKGGHCKKKEKGGPTPSLARLSQSGKGLVHHFQTSACERYRRFTGGSLSAGSNNSNSVLVEHPSSPGTTQGAFTTQDSFLSLSHMHRLSHTQITVHEWTHICCFLCF